MADTLSVGLGPKRYAIVRESAEFRTEEVPYVLLGLVPDVCDSRAGEDSVDCRGWGPETTAFAFDQFAVADLGVGFLIGFVEDVYEKGELGG